MDEMFSDPFTIRDVVGEGICVGCGACAVAVPAIGMRFTDRRVFEPALGDIGADDLDRADAVCPFSDRSSNETEIAKRLFPQETNHHSPNIGYFNDLAIGHITDDSLRIDSSSGGLTSWMLAELLRLKMVDGIVHVGSGRRDDDLFSRYVVSESVEEIYNRRKSQYFPHEFSQMLKNIRGNGKTYAFVGVPCFVKAARNLASADPVLGGQLKYFIGIVCGHLKSGSFAEYLAWQTKIPPSQAERVDFRVKDNNETANRYKFGAMDRNGEWRFRRMGSIYGGDWGTTFFQLKSCEYCDDIVAETADICFGDAWLRQYNLDWLGNNIIVCRNETMRRLLAEGVERGELALDPANEQKVFESQGGSFRHRRVGLSIRLEDARRRGAKTPRKRVAAGSLRAPLFFTSITRLRNRIAGLSHEAFGRARVAENLDLFVAEMTPLTDRLRQINRVRNLFQKKYWDSLIEKYVYRRIINRSKKVHSNRG